jgi:hypothetical protein
MDARAGIRIALVDSSGERTVTLQAR